MTAGPGEVRTRLFRTGGGLRVGDFLPGRDTPGDVGVCFSGGGTRSMLASTGQLRALRHLGLLGKTRAIVAVSGGAWATVPFTYLPADRPEADLLGEFVGDPGALRLGGGGPADLGEAAEHALVRIPTNRAMELSHAAAWMLWWMQPVHLGSGVAVERLWSSYVAMTILGALGFEVTSFNGRVRPGGSFFCWDADHEAALRADAPGLPARAFHAEVPGIPGRTPRPFPVVTTAMLVHARHQAVSEPFRFLAPVHSTPFFTGVTSSPDARDDRVEEGWLHTTIHETDARVGGGAPSSFAFDGELLEVGDMHARVRIERCFSLPDVVAAASCVYAERLRNRLVDQPRTLGRTAMLEALETVVAWVGGPAVTAASWAATAELTRTHALAPSHRYWSPGGPAGSTPSTFVDGGSLDNIGVPTLLAYEDIRRVVAFVNAGSALGRTPAGVVLDDPLPPLFGLRGEGGDYAPFPPLAEHGVDGLSQRRFNQVFPTDRFEEMRAGLADAMENSPTRTAVFLQRDLPVLENPWFGVPGNRSVDVLWVYLGRSDPWRDLLRDDEARAIADREWFPHWDTWSPHGSLPQANLLAHYTSWVTARAEPLLRELYSNG